MLSDQDSSISGEQNFAIKKLPPIFIDQGTFSGPPIECQPVITNVIFPVNVKSECQPVKPVITNVTFPVNVKSLPTIHKIRGLYTKPYKIKKSKRKSGVKPRVVANLVVPEVKLAPKSKDPKMWTIAPHSKKCRVGIANLASESFFFKAGSGGLTQAEREAYDIKKKHKKIPIFPNKPSHFDCNTVKYFEKS